jgi:hypothetical protein
VTDLEIWEWSEVGKLKVEFWAGIVVALQTKKWGPSGVLAGLQLPRNQLVGLQLQVDLGLQVALAIGRPARVPKGPQLQLNLSYSAGASVSFHVAFLQTVGNGSRMGISLNP